MESASVVFAAIYILEEKFDVFSIAVSVAHAEMLDYEVNEQKIAMVQVLVVLFFFKSTSDVRYILGLNIQFQFIKTNSHSVVI